MDLIFLLKLKAKSIIENKLKFVNPKKIITNNCYYYDINY